MLNTAIASLTSGGAYALLGVGLVLTYRMTGVLNFAHAVVGAFGTYTAIVAFEVGVPYGLAMVAGIVVAASVSAGIGLVMARWFAEATTIVRSTVTIAVFLGVLVVGFRLFGDTPRVVPAILPGVRVEVATVTLTASTLVAVGGVAVLAAAVAWFLAKTRTGIILRAVSERPTTARLLGAPLQTLVVAVWAVSGAVAGAAVAIIAPTRTNDYASLAILILPALAAALLGGFRRVGVTILAGFGIALVELLGARVPAVAQYRTVVPFVVILGALLWMQRKEVWDEAR